MCKHIEKLQTLCLNNELYVFAFARMDGENLVVRCGQCDTSVDLEGIGPDYPIAPIDDTYVPEEP